MSDDFENRSLANRLILDGLLGESLTSRLVVAGDSPTAQAVLFRCALEAFSVIRETDSDDVARAWMIGVNPQLDDRTPVDAIREGCVVDVLVAARAFANS